MALRRIARRATTRSTACAEAALAIDILRELQLRTPVVARIEGRTAALGALTALNGVSEDLDRTGNRPAASVGPPTRSGGARSRTRSQIGLPPGQRTLE